MKARGFTLIEVVVAAAIFGMAGTALFGLLSRSVVNLGKMEELHRYQLASEEMMNRVLLLPRLPAGGRAEGEVEGLKDARWTVKVQPWIPESLESQPSEAIVKIDVEVFWPGRSGRRNVRLETVKPVFLSYGVTDFDREIAEVFPN